MPSSPARLLLSATLLVIAVHTQAQISIVRDENPALALIPGDSMAGWQLQNTETGFFTVQDGILQVTGDRGWAQTDRQFGDFTLTGEFRFLEADADSGIFLRVEPGTDFIRGWPGDAYQVQIREISENTSDNPLPLLNLYRHRVPDGDTVYQRDRVFTLYSGVGEWHSFEIIARGDTLQASLNGEVVLSAEGLVNAVGHIGIQSEKGTIEYRYLTIHDQRL